MKFKIATILYNDATDETTITFGQNYKEFGSLLRADVMKDALHLVESEYNKSVDDLHKSWEKMSHKSAKPKNRGGARPGAGRPKGSRNKQAVIHADGSTIPIKISW